jgi:hypothetical protein
VLAPGEELQITLEKQLIGRELGAMEDVLVHKNRQCAGHLSSKYGHTSLQAHCSRVQGIHNILKILDGGRVHMRASARRTCKTSSSDFCVACAFSILMESISVRLQESCICRL